MSDIQNKTTDKLVYWPDLSAYGAKLSVVHNPSLGQNYLKLTILNRKQFTRDSGHNAGTTDFFRLAREFDFVYAPAEANVQFEWAYDTARSEGKSEFEAQQIAVEQAEKAYFYAPFLTVTQQMISTLVPASSIADFKNLPVSEIKHLDFQYLPKDRLDKLLESFQRTPRGEAGVFYTTPKDRALVADLQDSRVTINSLFGMRGTEIPVVEGGLADIAGLNMSRIGKRAFSGLSLTVNGQPLKSMRVKDTLLGFHSFEEAVSSNGGSADGVERVELPGGAPVAFGWPDRRILVVKNGAYLEIDKLFAADIAQEETLGATVVWHLQFIEAAKELEALVEQGRSEGLFDQESFLDLAAAQVQETRYAEIQTKMLACLKLVPASSLVIDSKRNGSDFINHIDLVTMSGLSPANFEKTFSREFLKFLGDFKNTLHPKMKEIVANFQAQKVIAKGQAQAKRVIDEKKDSVTADRREDAGVKIGGARKDYTKKCLSVADLGNLTDRERFELVKKNNIWAPLDYKKMREEGVPPAVAYTIAQIRKLVPVDPMKGGVNAGRNAKYRIREFSEEICLNYVNAVSFVRDQMMAVDCERKLLEAVFNIRRQFDLTLGGTKLGEYRSQYFGYNWQSSNSLQDAVGYNFCQKLPGVDFEVDVDDIGNLDEVPCYLEVNLKDDDVRRHVRFGSIKTQGKWDWAIKEEAEAEVSADEPGVETKKVERVAKPEPVALHLEHIRRTGPEHRGDKSTDEQLLLDVFGFRGVEYGNWLPQKERQVVLDHAFDAFMDLSEVLGLPPKAIGLGGGLSTAFGARGSGGKGAALAHYEPGRNVMNLTRMSGAGALAHEFGHAFDYWLEKAFGRGSVHAFTSEYQKTGSLKAPLADQPFVKQLKAIFTAMKERPETIDDVVSRSLFVRQNKTESKHVSEVLSTNLRSWVRNYRFMLPVDERDAFHTAGNKLIDDALEIVPGLEPHQVKCVNDVELLITNLRTLVDVGATVEMKRSNKLDVSYLRKVNEWSMRVIHNAEVRIAQFQPGTGTAESEFLKASKDFDTYRSKPYWSTDIELFARGFEAWVQDRVQATPGRVSDFLVHGRSVSGWPLGEERQRINAAFDALFSEMRPQLIDALALADAKKDDAQLNLTM